MTKAEIASHVCEVVGTTDDESIALCKTFIQRRYSLVWDSHPWRETLDVITGQTTNGYRNVVFQNSTQIERILSVVYDDISLLEPWELVSLWQRDSAAHATTGGIFGGFTLLPRTALILGDEALAEATLGLGAQAPGIDGAKSLTLTLTGTDLTGADQTKTVLLMPGGSYYQITGTWKTVTSVTADTNTWLDSILPSGSVVVSKYPGAIPTFLDMDSTLLSAPLNHQIRLSQKATGVKTVRAVGKLRCPTLADSSTPTLPNVTEPLVGLVQADMLERQRQYSKAQAKRAEAGALVSGLLVDLQRRQSADGMQIIPDMEPAPYGPGASQQKGYW